MREAQSISQVPWHVSREEFVRASAEVPKDGACCVFVIDDSIPASARGGYAALVIAYARADEPVHILQDGAAALLVREGGVGSARVVSERMLSQMKRLSLEQTLRIGVAALPGGAEDALQRARHAAESVAPGEIGISE